MANTRRLVLKGGHVLDVLSGQVLQDAVIFIEEGRIAQIHHQDSLCMDHFTEEEVIDLADLWVIPGLIDMHVHVKEANAPYFLAAGVTTVRNMAGNVLELQRLRKVPANAPSPRVISADRMIDGEPGLWGATDPWNFVTDDPQQARLEVRRQLSVGADLIKVYGLLSKECMQAALEEAQAHQKEVSGDLIYQTQVNALEAAKLGINWLEHASGIIQAVYPHWSMAADEDIWAQIPWEQPPVAELEAVCRELIAQGVKLCPTMTLYDQMQKLSEPWWPEHHFIAQEMQRNSLLIKRWQGMSQAPGAFRKMGLQGTFNKAIAKIYADLGGIVVAGTDAPAGLWNAPGLALHRELELFVEIGFSELEALQMATCQAGDALQRKDLGRVQEGAVADLLLLAGNPLEDIRYTQELRMVIKGGVVYQPDQVLEYLPTESQLEKDEHEFVQIFTRQIEQFFVEHAHKSMKN